MDVWTDRWTDRWVDGWTGAQERRSPSGPLCSPEVLLQGFDAALELLTVLVLLLQLPQGLLAGRLQPLDLLLGLVHLPLQRLDPQTQLGKGGEESAQGESRPPKRRGGLETPYLPRPWLLKLQFPACSWAEVLRWVTSGGPGSSASTSQMACGGHYVGLQQAVIVYRAKQCLVWGSTSHPAWWTPHLKPTPEMTWPKATLNHPTFFRS